MALELSARSAYRGQVTKIVKSANDFLDSEASQLISATDLDAVEEDIVAFIQRLTAAHESLNTTNQEVQNKSLLKTDDLDREFEKITEYQDAAIGALSRLNSRLLKIRRKQNPSIPSEDKPSLNVSSAVSCSLKLPKLQLKRFDGNYQDWLPFWEQFRNTIHENDNLTSSDKFSYLESVLVGSAKKIIAGFTASGLCYEAAISLLKEQFGDTERLVDKNMQHLISLRPVQSKTDAVGLRNLYNSITSCCRTLTALQIPTHQYYVMLKSILLRCLPPELRVDYYRLAERDDNGLETSEADEENSSTSLQVGDKQVKDIMRFLKREVESLERSRVTSSIPSTSHDSHSPPTHTTAASLVGLSEKSMCVFCDSDKHITKDCDSKLSITEKRDILRKSGRCFRCANRGHSSRKCLSAKWMSCVKCKGKHLTSLCDPSYASQQVSSALAVMRDNESSQNAVDFCADNFSSMPEQQIDPTLQSATNLCAYNSCSVNSNVFLKTARGIAVAPSENKSLLIRVVIDGGSQYSYIREDLVQKLKLSAVGEVHFSLIPFGCKERSPFKKFRKVNVHIKSQFNNRSVNLEAVVVPEICIDVLHAPDASCTLIQNLQLADSYHAGIKAENGLSVLIGSDHYWSVVTGKQRRISAGLRAVDTIFGWTLQGTHSVGKDFASNENSCFPSIHSTALHLPVLNSNDLTAFWSLEAIGIRGEEEENEQLAEELITKCITKKGQRYEASLPWKNHDAEIKSNRETAAKRLKSLFTRLSRYPQQLQQYDAGIQELLADGFAEPIPRPNSSELRRVLYLPHRPVYKADSTTTKMRIKESSVPKTSKIAQLCPFLDKDGLMRLGGRLQSLKGSMDSKHPMILPSDSYLVKLLIDDYHQRTLHGGTNVVLCQLRERFWIRKGRPLIKGRIRRCVICQKLFGKPVSQPTGPLPIERITLSKPFDCVGIDFAGPLYYCENSPNQMNKSYLMIFTCAVIRSVHLETVTNLSTESCIMGLRRFIARRGAPPTIYSDNAKSFRRAALEIDDRNQAPADEAVQRFLSNKRIRWKFIVERAPWWGGFWERLVRTIKNVLKVVIGRSKLTFEQLRTVIAEAEYMVNVRPLTYVSSDPLDASPLTPSHFIQGQGGRVDPGKSPTSSSDIQQIWAQRLKQINMLWIRWRTEYLQQLRSFHHSQGYSSAQLKPNDVVLVFDAAKPRIAWRLAIIENSFTGRNGKIRACEIRYADGSRTRRPVQLLYPLELTTTSRAEDVKNN